MNPLAPEAHHRCFASGCMVQLPPRLLMCRTHWRRVPRPLQEAVWATYSNGAGVGTPEHYAAIRAARQALIDQDTPTAAGVS